MKLVEHAISVGKDVRQHIRETLKKLLETGRFRIGTFLKELIEKYTPNDEYTPNDQGKNKCNLFQKILLIGGLCNMLNCGNFCKPGVGTLITNSREYGFSLFY